MERENTSMDDNPRRPVVLAIAGPNGSGKSTIAKEYSPFDVYVNADDMGREHGLSTQEAARRAESLRNELVENGTSFTFETVMSTDRNILLLEKAKKHGFEVQCIYILTRNVNINVARVRTRVMAGGHDVPETKIRERYRRALALLPRLIAVCDKILIYDNSENDGPVLLLKKGNNRMDLYPNPYWPKAALQKLF